MKLRCECNLWLPNTEVGGLTTCKGCGKTWLLVHYTNDKKYALSEVVKKGEPQDNRLETILKRVAQKLEVDIEDVQ